MTQLVFFLEEPSAEEMLKAVLPKFLPDAVETQFIVFEGKQDLEKRLFKKLRGWLWADARFIVLRDQDSGNCVEIKRRLKQICVDAGRPESLIRIACHELESFYLGDLAAVAKAFQNPGIEKMQRKANYKKPDRLANPKQELKKLIPQYQQISGSRDIAEWMNIDENKSHSFNILISGIKQLVGNY